MREWWSNNKNSFVVFCERLKKRVYYISEDHSLIVMQPLL